MAMSMASTRPSTGQKPLEACYGFPPPPSALRQLSTTFAAKQTQALNLPISSVSASATAPVSPTAPSVHSLVGDDLQEVEYGSNLADYLAKNPGVKRLYSNHGCIKRPACVSCNESRKKCDLERPCARCVKQKLPCIERPPRGSKRRKIEEEGNIPKPKPKSRKKPPLPSLPPLLHPAAVHSAPYGLPSPVSEHHCGSRVGTPMELDTPVASIVHEHSPGTSCCTTPAPGGSPEMGLPNDNANFNHNISIITTPDNSSTAGISDLPLEFLEVPCPDFYLKGISSKHSAVPIYGLESVDSSVQEKIHKELEWDLEDDDHKLDNLLGMADGLTREEEEIPIDFNNIDFDALMSFMPTEQEMKDLLGGDAGDLGDFSTTTGVDLSTTGAFSWDDWSID